MKESTNKERKIAGGYGGLFVNDKVFYHNSENEGGDIIKFVQKYQGMDFRRAVNHILGLYDDNIDFSVFKNKVTNYEKKEREPMVMPKLDTDTSISFNYLVNDRGIDADIVNDAIEKGSVVQVVTEHKEYIFKNCGFVGFDKDNKPSYCAIRGVKDSNDFKFRQDIKNSNKEYGFKIYGNSNRVFVFESPIDALSHATLFKLNNLDYTQDTRISEGGLFDKSLIIFLKDNPHINDIVFCFDNDKDAVNQNNEPHNIGQKFAKKCLEKFRNQGYNVKIQKAENKDFNEDLQMIRKSIRNKLSEVSKNISDSENTKNKNFDKGGR